MATQKQRIEAALAARGEQRKEQLAAGTKWTRNFCGTRSISGSLVPTSGKHYWFVGVNGSLRVGASKRISKRAKEEVKEALLLEGEVALVKQQR